MPRKLCLMLLQLLLDPEKHGQVVVVNAQPATSSASSKHEHSVWTISHGRFIARQGSNQQVYCNTGFKSHCQVQQSEAGGTNNNWVVMQEVVRYHLLLLPLDFIHNIVIEPQL